MDDNVNKDTGREVCDAVSIGQLQVVVGLSSRPNEHLLRLGRLDSGRVATADTTIHFDNNEAACNTETPSYESVMNLPAWQSQNDEEKPPSYESVIKPCGDLATTPSSSQLPPYQEVGSADEPPSYHTIFTESVLMRALNAFTNNDDGTPSEHIIHTYKLSGILLNMVIFVLLIIFVLVLPIAMVTVGLLYYDECPVQPRIPIYLIVLGFFQMLECCGRLGYKFFQSHNGNQRNTWRERYRRKDPLIYFVIVWFVIGSMWVYQTNPECQDCQDSSIPGAKYNATNFNVSSTINPITTMATEIKKHSVYCDLTVYSFAFWVITVYYSIIGFFCFLIFIDVFSRTVIRCCCS